MGSDKASPACNQNGLICHDFEMSVTTKLILGTYIPGCRWFVAVFVENIPHGVSAGEKRPQFRRF
jgi:hypothetical protein